MVDARVDATEQQQAPARLVLIIEDEASLSTSLAYFLRANGFRATTAMDGASGLAAAQREHPDVVVLDIMLPHMDGLEVCRRIRAESDVPIVMLTARTEEMDRVVGLELGADDYVTKPFSMRELTARIRAVLRRGTTRAQVQHATTIVAGALAIDPRGRTVQLRGREITMKPKEFDLLYFLAGNADQVFTRQQLLERVWGYEFFGSGRTVDVHVRWLREKIEDEPGQPRHLLTARGVGYKFVR